MAGDALDELLAHPGRATRALVDLDAVRDNARRLADHLGAGAKLMAVVKADGYGHGATRVAREAIAGGATWLGVATVAEGAELRADGFMIPILVLGPIDSSELDAACRGELDITVGQPQLVDALVARAEVGNRVPRLHIKVETGMHRLGLEPEDVVSAAQRLEDAAPGRIYALATHLACADDPGSALTSRQLRVLNDVVAQVRSTIPALAVHAANSWAAASREGAEMGIARLGIALYGCGLPPERLASLHVRPAMSVVSRLMRVHELREGDGVGYGSTYVAQRPERVGLVPLGYADGYHRTLSNRGRMTIAGADCPVRGRVCMDQVVIGNVPMAAVAGEWVGVAGPALDGPSWADLADAAGTIDYELLTSVGRRVARLYHRSGRLVAVRDELGRYVDIADDNNAPAADRWPGRAT